MKKVPQLYLVLAYNTFFLCWSLSFFFLLITTVNILNIQFPVAVFRTIRDFTVQIVIFNPITDKIIGLLFPVFLIFFIFKKDFFIKRISALTFFTYLILILVLVELMSLLGWILNGFIPKFVTLYPNIKWYPAFVELQLFNILHPALPVLVLVSLFSFLLKPSFSFLTKKISNQKEFFLLKLKASRILLFTSILAGIFVCFYPLLPAVNPKFTVFGVDIPYYNEVLEELFSFGYLNTLNTPNIFFRERIVYHTFQYLITLLIPLSTTQTLQFTTLILTGLLILAVYFFVKAGIKNDFVAGCAALFTAFSFNVTVGLTSAIYSNWLALTETYIFLGLYLLANERKEAKFLVLTIPVSILILYTHPWTWSFTMAILGLYFLVNLWHSKSEGLTQERRWEIKALILIFTINILFDFLKKLCFQIPSGVETGYTTSLSMLNLLNPLLIRLNMQRTLVTMVGGYYANPLTYILSVTGIVLMLNFKDRFNKILVLWLIVGCLTFIFSSWLQWRILYMLPFQVYSAMGLLAILKIVNGQDKTSKTLQTLIILLTYLIMANYALRCAANMVPL